MSKGSRGSRRLKKFVLKLRNKSDMVSNIMRLLLARLMRYFLCHLEHLEANCQSMQVELTLVLLNRLFLRPSEFFFS
jgi:hypothetical protein